MLFGRCPLLPLAAVVLLLAGRAAATPTPTGTPVFVPTPPGLFTLTGHVAAGPGCAGDLAGVTVSIPRFRETVTGADGRFQFSDLTYGNYYLQFSPNCPLIPCYPDRIVFIDASGDVDIDVCRDDCPATALLSLRSGAPGSLLDVSGRCDAARDEAVAIWFDDRQVASLTADADGVYRGTVTVPRDAVPDAEHLVRAELGEHEIASGDFMTVYGAAPCVGDCNRDGTVTIDELLRGIRIALGLDTTAACHSMDASSNGVVSIEELITGVQRALSGCQRADLVPLDARYSRCVDYPCYAAEQIPAFMNVCVANQGDADSGGFLIYESTTGFSVFAPPLLAGAQECVEMRLVADPEIEVDASHLIPEHDETNNFLVTSIPVRTACDVVPPPCTPTPPPTVTQTPTAT